jgi:hypothetical protein
VGRFIVRQLAQFTTLGLAIRNDGTKCEH